MIANLNSRRTASQINVRASLQGFDIGRWIILSRIFLLRLLTNGIVIFASQERSLVSSKISDVAKYLMPWWMIAERLSEYGSDKYRQTCAELPNRDIKRC